jgi:hypothetical protein
MYGAGRANWGAAGVGAAYQFTLDATSNLRQKDDCYSEAVAGFVAGVGVGVASTSGNLHSWSGADRLQDEAFRSCSAPEPLSPPSSLPTDTPMACVA